MADSKLSALTEATSYTSADEFYINDGGTSKKITAANLQASLAGATFELTNKTFDLGSNTLTGSLAEFNAALQSASFVSLAGTETLTNKTLTSPTINTPTISGATLNDGYIEEVYTVTGATPALDPANGSIQVWTLPGNSTPTFAAGWGTGESMTLMVDDGSSSTITWPSMTWFPNGTQPTLRQTGYNIIVIWKVDTAYYGTFT